MHHRIFWLASAALVALVQVGTVAAQQSGFGGRPGFSSGGQQPAFGGRPGFPAGGQRPGPQAAPTASPPEEARPYLERAVAARGAGDSEAELAALQEGLKALGSESSAAFWISQRLRLYYADRGNAVQAARTAEAQLKTAPNAGQELQVLAALAVSRSALRDRDGAKQALERAAQLLSKLRGAPAWGRWGNLWQAMSAWATGHYHANGGHIAEAEAGWQACLSAIQNFLGPNPDLATQQTFFLADCSVGLIMAMLQQGKLAEAGAIAAQQRSLIESFSQVQQRPQLVARLAPAFARVALEQGRSDEARRILTRALDQQLAASAGEGSLRVANLRLLLALVEMLEGNWAKALEIHEIRRRGLQSALGERGNIGVASPELGYTLVRLGRGREAVEVLVRVVEARERLYDEASLYRWEARAFYGIALAAAGRRDAAFKELSAAVPRVIELAHGERSSADSGVLRTARLNWILDGYISLLAEYARAGERPGGIDAVNEAFRMADLARGSTVQRALAASASRATIRDPDLAALARREQDLQREISSLSDAIGNLLSRGRISEQDKIVADMRATLVRLRADHERALRELRRGFPEYADLLEPRPVSIGEVQKLLKPGEALVSVYTGPAHALVWAVPAQGQAAFAVASLSAAQLGERVAKLRRALDPGEVPIERMPRFDFDTAHELYQQLLAPVEAGWKPARELIVVPHGRLGQLPFAVLTTAPWRGNGTAIPFADMADAPWLIKSVALSQLPAAIALSALRGRPSAERPQRTFVGFGDPIFAVSESAAGSVTRGLGRRNLIISASEEKRSDIAASVDFALLARLPDTADEILEVSKALRADPARDVFLQRRASEHNVKSTDLSAYRIIMFATHGLVPGEMPGLYQPALALSNPALSGDGEDGMLTMEEILQLRLRADWVVLSACNTAAAGGNGSEAVSGLGRAFFFAGAKALLVTHWSVETVSARMLTTDAFRRQAETPTLSRARAMQLSALDLMKRSAANSFSYAHPTFWAPYIVVGDGG